MARTPPGQGAPGRFLCISGQQSLDRWIVEVRLQPDVNRRPMSRTHLLVDDPWHCEICDAGGSQGYTGPGGHQAHYSRPLRSLLHNVWPEAFCFTACESSIEGKRTHSPREKYKRLVSKISGSNCDPAGKPVTNREYRNESFSQDRFNGKPLPRFGVAKEAQVQCSIPQRGNLLSGDQFSQP